MAKVNGSEPPRTRCMRHRSGCRGEFYRVRYERVIHRPRSAARASRHLGVHQVAGLAACREHLQQAHRRSGAASQLRRTVEPVPDWMIDHLPPGAAGKQIK